jgi:hypothetical protein
MHGLHIETSGEKILHLPLAVRVGSEIERYVIEREEDMRKQQGGGDDKSS